MHTVPCLANEFVTVYESPDPEHIYAYTPGLARLDNGRLVATMDQGGPGVHALAGIKGHSRDGRRAWQGLIWTSDDRGKTWVQRAKVPLTHARPFVAGHALYVLGHSEDLGILCSEDGGETWSQTAYLTSGETWHQSACNVHYANGKVYLIMEKRARHTCTGWPVRDLAPVTMAASVQADLMQRQNWTFASELVFGDHVDQVDELGVPFWPLGPTAPDAAGDKRTMAPIGWLETNIVQFVDPDHVWYDPAGRTFYLWMRAHTGSTNMACIAKVVEGPQGSMSTSLVTSPAGVRMLYVPCPGGHMRFHILYDEQTCLYWLLSSLSTDSMTRPDRLSKIRFNLPNNERHILALYYSRNCVDWCMAGVVARGENPQQARHYASMCIDGDDLHVLSRSGNARAHSAHDGNLITFHTVRDFRELVYT